MAYPKGIVLALVALGEARKATVQAIGGKIVAASGQYLMAVGLVAHVPYELVVGRIEDIVQSYRKLNHAQASPEMAAVHRHIVDDILPQFVAQLR